MATEFSVEHDGVTLHGEQAGAGVPVLLLHGLTATRRYVVMGSRLLERSGHRVIAYDARGHGRSSPAPSPDAYGYELLAGDALAIMDSLGIGQAVLAGASMGAHTLLNLALKNPERVAGIVVITPAYSGDEALERSRLARWDKLAEGLRHGGVDGFLAAFGTPPGSPEFARTVLTVTRQRLSQHQHPEALADALSSVPRSRPFASLADLEHLDLPAAVVVSSDEADPEHPEALGRAYAAAIPGARLITDPPGRSPVAWQGSQLSQIIAEVAAETALAQRS
ncbi:alpha/beta fold hydrolase [Conexibacter sp. S30A1]|jgi:pimeloyl-ACP methyl ester carboxylesterase|uniref:alpha/beta fold hydrolase n=1 Tax=Conexibacter sp. S30A1 TaxID=2937800 RepID=UPI00200F05F7|nr:alpha/beta hydrolase [Conexibacter sp. S30A1]